MAMRTRRQLSLLLLLTAFNGCATLDTDALVDQTAERVSNSVIDSLAKIEAKITTELDQRRENDVQSGDGGISIGSIEAGGGLLAACLLLGQSLMIRRRDRALKAVIQGVEQFSPGTGAAVKKYVCTRASRAKIEKFLAGKVKRWTG